MPNFAANLNFFYGDLPFLERFPAAKRDGFKGVEFVEPYMCAPEEVAKVTKENGITTALFNAAIGDWSKGERGLTVIEDREDDFRALIDKVPAYAKALECPRVNVMAGINTNKSEAYDKTWTRLIERLRYAADTLGKHGITVLLEHINNFDIPGYFVRTPNEALKAIQEVDRANCMIQYDIYHAQREQGELTAFMRENISRIGHVQIADNPGRNQPGTGELNYKFLLDELDRLGFKGWVGFEYKPLPNAAGSLGWIKEMGYSL